jgi:DNA-binding transcriptional ArsR family regulator
MTMQSVDSDPGSAAPDEVLDQVGATGLDTAAALFRAMGDPSRLAILGHLMLGEHRVRELTEHLGLAQSTVSEHLRCLLDCGLVRVRAEGRASVYSLAVEPEVRTLLLAAEQLLATTGDAVLLCPRAARTRRSR